MSHPTTISPGQKFHRWTILQEVKPSDGEPYRRYVEARCECGTVKVLKLIALTKSRATQSCGCLGKELNQARLPAVPVGQVFHYWTVLRGVPRPPDEVPKKRYVEAQCQCGTISTLQLASLKSGHSKSCGCYRSERSAEVHTKHGKVNSPEWFVWTGIHNRCKNLNEPSYPNYGGRGIVVCERWKEFAPFLEDMGEKPTPEHTIERIDNDGPYSPENCRWATRTE